MDQRAFAPVGIFAKAKARPTEFRLAPREEGLFGTFGAAALNESSSTTARFSWQPAKDTEPELPDPLTAAAAAAASRPPPNPKSLPQQPRAAAAAAAAAGPAAAAPWRPRAPQQPDFGTCKTAIAAMMSRTQNGMRQGLTDLELPDYGLAFTPGEQLRLCGYDIRDLVNRMIHHCLEDERDGFYATLQSIRALISDPILSKEDLLAGRLDMRDWQEFYAEDGSRRWRLLRCHRSPDGREVGLAERDPDAVGASGDDDGDDDEDAAAEDGEDEVIDVPAARDNGAEVIDVKPGVSSTPASSLPPKAARPQEDGFEDYYALMGLGREATASEIRGRFRERVVQVHPSKGGNVQAFQRLNRAYSVLIDASRRREYDKEWSRHRAAQRT